MPDDECPLLMTERLSVHPLGLADAAFVARLLNEPGFVRFIGDKGVRNEEDARRYLEDGTLADYRAHGYGAYLVRSRDGGHPVGVCGFYHRKNLDCPDLGFAFSESTWGRGYAVEASTALLEYGRETFGLAEVAAIVDPDNARSIRVIEKLGFSADGDFRMPDEDGALRLYRRRLARNV